MDGPETRHHRQLPHYQPECGTFFIAFRLADSLPTDILTRLKEEHTQRENQLRAKGGHAELPLARATQGAGGSASIPKLQLTDPKTNSTETVILTRVA